MGGAAAHPSTCLRRHFNSPDPEDQGIDEYRQWINDVMPGTDAVAASFIPCDKHQGSWSGWVFKTGGRGLGYYLDGILHDQPETQEETADLLRGLAPAELKLDGLIPDLQRIGDPLKATMQDDKVNEQKKEARKHKTKKARAANAGNAESWILKAAIEGSDCSHRDHGLWAVETANPNAWNGATEYLNSSAADFLAFQETKVDKGDVNDAENAARNLRWSASVSPCLQGAGGGKSAGVAVACREHIGMSTSCEEVDLPKSLQGRFTVKHVKAMCKGGFTWRAATCTARWAPSTNLIWIYCKTPVWY